MNSSVAALNDLWTNKLLAALIQIDKIASAGTAPTAGAGTAPTAGAGAALRSYPPQHGFVYEIAPESNLDLRVTATKGSNGIDLLKPDAAAGQQFKAHQVGDQFVFEPLCESGSAIESTHRTSPNNVGGGECRIWSHSDLANNDTRFSVTHSPQGGLFVSSARDGSADDLFWAVQGTKLISTIGAPQEFIFRTPGFIEANVDAPGIPRTAGGGGTAPPLAVIPPIARDGEGGLMPDHIRMPKATWYRLIFDVTSANINAAQELHTHIKEFVETYLAPQWNERILPSIQAEKEGEIDSERLFEVVARVYGEFRISKDFVVAVAGSLDQGLSGRPLPTIDKMYLKAFHGLVYSKVKNPLLECILRHVARRRNGENVNMETLKNATDFLITVGACTATSSADRDAIYQGDFEKPYLDCLKAAYAGKAAAEIQRQGHQSTFTGTGGELYCARPDPEVDYLQWVDDRFKLERDFAVTSCRKPTYEKVDAELVELLLRDQMHQVITSTGAPPASSNRRNPWGCGFAALLERENEDKIRQMYRLFSLVPDNEAVVIMAAVMKAKCKASLAPFFQEYEQMDHPVNDKTLVDKNIDLYKKYTGMVKNLCEGDALLQYAIKESFVEAVNGKFKRKVTKPGSDDVTYDEANYSEVLTNFLDRCLKGEFKDITDPEEEKLRLELIATQFSYIKDKDVFQELYRKKLAKRLPLGSPNQELEQAFLGELKKLQGPNFTNSLEGMFNDRERANETNDAFLERYAEKIPCKFHCLVLTRNHWPSYESDKMCPIGSLDTCLKAFTLFYKENFQGLKGRKLEWLHSEGNADMIIHFDKGRKEVNLSFYQAHILISILENGEVGLTGQMVAEKMGLGFGDVKPHLATLYLSKSFKMLCHAVGEDGKAPPADKEKLKAPNTTYQLNPSFTHKEHKFKVGALNQGGSNQGVNKEAINKGRLVVIDACVVRIMKARRVINLSDLEIAVVTQLSKTFVPTPKQIKLRIEDLINREFLKRDPEQPDKFEYLA